MRKTLIAYSITAAAAVWGCGKSSNDTGAAAAPDAAPAEAAAETAAAAPEVPAGAADVAGAAGLTDMLGSKLGLSPDQAKAGVGAILAYAEGALPSTDFQKVSAAIPGAGDNIQAAKDAGAVSGPITDAAGLNTAFGKLGISPEVANQLVPAVTDYVGKMAGPETANLLKGLFP
jgi:Protein of unknown function VcgC/VcgE (DUF2780)